MAKRCYYEVLEVERTANDAQLKAAFRKLAMQYHPDRNPGDTSEHKFKEINEAYEVLKDGDKRAAYDRFGHAAFEQGGVGAGGNFGADFGSAFSDLFEGIFGMGGGQRGRSGRERGADLRYNMEISLDEAFAGKAAQLRIPTSARPAPAPAPRPAPSPRSARPARVPAASATPRAFSRWSGPARPARAAAR
jgi:molecular chaperone DnaJ